MGRQSLGRLGFLVLVWSLIAGEASAAMVCGLCRCLAPETRAAGFQRLKPITVSTGRQLFSGNPQCLFPVVCIEFNAAARDNAVTRACFAEQKTILGAIEIYQVDKKSTCNHAIAEAFQRKEENTPRIAVLTEEFLQELVKGGYLQSLPTDSRFGAARYGYTNFGSGVLCLIHGEMDGGVHKYAAADLRERGVQDPVALAAAFESPPLPRGYFHCSQCLMGTVSAVLLLVDLWWVGSMFYLVCSLFLLPAVAIFAPISTVILVLVVASRARKKY